VTSSRELIALRNRLDFFRGLAMGLLLAAQAQPEKNRPLTPAELFALRVTLEDAYALVEHLREQLGR
jgi:hypothetical protein